MVVVADGWNDSSVEITSFRRNGADDEWAKRGEIIPATIGEAGLGWGIGLHGVGAPSSSRERASERAGPTKKEGDGRSPAGVFSLGASFGYSKSPPAASKLPYTPLNRRWRCVDDPRSRHYNDVLPEREASKIDWKSAETMRRRDELYRWVVLVDHNHIRANASGEQRAEGKKPQPGGGSCIFFHVWREPGSATVGCAAMDRTQLESMMSWLDPAKRPVTVILPRGEYDRRRAAWQLPLL